MEVFIEKKNVGDYFKDLAKAQLMNKQGGLEGNSILSFDKENMERNNKKDFKHIS